MTFEIYKLEWILSRHTFGNTTTYFVFTGNKSLIAFKLKNLKVIDAFSLKVIQKKQPISIKTIS